MITHPEKVMFPEDGITKGDLAAYYESVAPLMLPHIAGRPVTMERYPAGIAKILLNEFDTAKIEKLAIVFGNEVTGVEQSTILLCDGCLEIPQLGMKHSLNNATAAGVVLWELVRTRLHIARHSGAR